MEDCLDLVPVKELVDWRVTRRSLDLLRTSCLLVLLLESPRLLPLQLRESSSWSRTRMRLSSRDVLTSLTLVSLTAPPECSRLRESTPSGEETWPMCSDTSLLRLLTLPSRMPLRSPSPPPRMPARPRSSP